VKEFFTVLKLKNMFAETLSYKYNSLLSMRRARSRFS